MNPKKLRFDGKTIGLYWEQDDVDYECAELWLSSDYANISNETLRQCFNNKKLWAISKNINQSWLDYHYGDVL